MLVALLVTIIAQGLLTCSGRLGATQTSQLWGPFVPSIPERFLFPESGWSPIPLSDLWGQNGCDFVENFVSTQLLPSHEVGQRLKASGVVRPYSDPLLSQQSTYAALLRRMYSSNLVEFTRDAGREQISIFFVTKKNDKQRLIIDARRVNCHFRDPAYVSLCAGDTLSRIEMNAGETLRIGMADLKDAFYHLELPPELRPFFSLKPIAARYIKDFFPGAGQAGDNTRWWPRLAVVPMGWSHALFICQKLHERLVVQSGISDMDRLQDRRPIQQSECLHLQYVDNLVVLGTDEKTVTSSFRGSVEKLKGAGLQVHEVELGNEGAQVLGWAISPDGKMRPTEKRLWKVRLAIRELLKRGRASPRQIEKLLGHCCFISLARREALSIFGHVYSFVHRNGDPHKVPLWPTVRKEFDVWAGILPLIWRDYTSPWSEKVYAVDASEWGLGCTTAHMDVKMVQQIGSFCERWRFKDPLVPKARASVEIDPHDMYPVQLPLFYDDTPAEPNQAGWQQFMPVPFEAVQREWKTGTTQMASTIIHACQ